MTERVSDSIDNAEKWGRSVLGCLLEDPSLWPETEDLEIGNFVGSNQQKIFGAMNKLHAEGCVADVAMLMFALEGQVDASYIGSLIDSTVRGNFPQYVRMLKKSARDRRFHEMHAKLGEAKSAEDRLALLALMREVIEGAHDVQNWALFHSTEEIENAPPLRFANRWISARTWSHTDRRTG